MVSEILPRVFARWSGMNLSWVWCQIFLKEVNPLLRLHKKKHMKMTSVDRCAIYFYISVGRNVRKSFCYFVCVFFFGGVGGVYFLKLKSSSAILWFFFSSREQFVEVIQVIVESPSSLPHERLLLEGTPFPPWMSHLSSAAGVNKGRLITLNVCCDSLVSNKSFSPGGLIFISGWLFFLLRYQTYEVR